MRMLWLKKKYACSKIEKSTEQKKRSRNLDEMQQCSCPKRDIAIKRLSKHKRVTWSGKMIEPYVFSDDLLGVEIEV